VSQQQVDILCLIALCVALPVIHVIESRLKLRRKPTPQKETLDESADDKLAGRGR